ncbi:MAG TPA: ABC transporter ATP-binding protein, partial [Acidimicrobiales bacterium]
MATLTLEGVAKRFGPSVTAVEDVSFEVSDGGFLVLVGPSGCGKSTLLKMIAGLEDVTDGEIRIDGYRVNELGPRERDIAMVFQTYALYPHLTVRKNIAYPLKVARVGRREIERRVAETAELLELGDLLDRRPAELSGGQRQRVAMGRAIVRRPRVFLMDEPLSNLDARLRVQMRAEISGLQRELGITTVYVTHDQVEAMTMGSQVAVLLAGRLQQIATPRRLYDEP